MPKYRNSLNQFSKNQGKEVSRRGFLAMLGWALVGVVTAILGGTIFSFLYPNALKIPPSLFSIGRPQDLLASQGRVFLPKQKAFVEVDQGRVRCQTAVCTHLGCTVNAVPTGFKCPCHGSTYDLDGLNTGGPAPRPLDYFKIVRGASGDLLVDKTQIIHNPKEAWYSLTL